MQDKDTVTKDKVIKDKVIKIKFVDGTFQVFKKVKEHVSGFQYFFLVQEVGSELFCQAFFREDIEVVERGAFKGTWKMVKLKKVKNELVNSNTSNTAF